MVTRPPSYDEIKAFKETFFDKFPTPPTFTLFNGAFIEFDIENATLVCSFEPGTNLTNPAGGIQGGIITAMMDDTMGPLMVAMNAGQAFPASTDLHTRYYRPVKPGEKLRCEAKISRQGRTLCYTEARLYNEKNQEVAHCVHTAVMRRMSNAT